MPCALHAVPAVQVWPIWEAGWVECKLPPWQEEERERQQRRQQEEEPQRQQQGPAR